VARAEALYLQLLSSMKETRVLHGDLHHGNILSAEREPWLAIDPKGLIGEAEFEVIAYLRNHLMKHDNPGQVLERRIDQLASHLKLDRERMISWGVCHCVLSAWWSVEDGQDDWHEVMACGELFNGLLK
ncbi:aminoglycoside phosphotransferase family protein, partial [Paenibacillus sepulcri]|nr:aminoglycoside phosphotransferase family protein [Paenibacillus sepulcri]